MPYTMRKDVVYHDKGCCMPLKSMYRIMYAMKEAAVYHKRMLYALRESIILIWTGVSALLEEELLI